MKINPEDVLALGAVSGRIGAHVFVRKGDTSYTRKFVKPANPRTAQQMFTRKLFKELSDMWDFKLSSAQREAWSFFSKTRAISKYGLNAFEKINHLPWLMGLSVKKDPPVNDSPPSILYVNCEAHTPAQKVFSFLVDYRNAFIFVKSSFPVRPSIHFPRKNLFALLERPEPPCNIAKFYCIRGRYTCVDLSLQYQWRFGRSGIPGQRVFYRFVAVDPETNLQSSPMYCDYLLK